MEDRDYIDPNKLALDFLIHTPDEKTEINMEGKNFEINIDEILSVLKNTTQKYFDKIDYSLLTTSKNILSHFYYNEKECLFILKKYSYNKRKFYKSLIYDSIFEIFIQGPKKIIKEIMDNLEKVKIAIEKKEKNYEEITLEDFYNILEEQLGTKEVPKFLIRDDLKYVKFRQNYQDKKRPEVEKILIYYKKIKNRNLRPFDYIKNKNILFDIFILSNGKDLFDNESSNKILIDNYKEIISWFDLKLDKKNFEYVYDNLINISPKEKNDLLESFFIAINNEFTNLKACEDLYLILFSSFFYCILYKLKLKDQNGIIINNNEINITNSRITKFLTNVIDSFIIYLKDCQYNIKGLINELFEYELLQINKNEKEKIQRDSKSINSTESKNKTKSIIINSFYQEENIDYDFKMIEEKIMESDDNNLKEKFQQVKSKLKIEPINFPETIVGTLFKIIVNIFTSNIYYYANYIRLSPFQKYASSNTVTIFVSGFGSENDVHCIEWKKYIENDTRNTTYYFYHWPGDSFTKIVLKSLPIGLGGIKFDSDLPKVFMESKEKAKVSGKILSFVLRSRLFFGNRQINLVSFSLGNHVVKNCLKELSRNDEGRMLINDVTFMAGATTFKDRGNWNKIFKEIVSGRIINCYSKSDNILKYLYSNCTGKEPIGIKEVDINDGKNGKNIVENYDFTDLNLGHLDYREKFNEILKRINN